MDINVSTDGEQVILGIGESEARLTLDQFYDFTHRLGVARAQIMQKVPTAPTPNPYQVFTGDPVSFVALKDGTTVLGLFHICSGWQMFTLSGAGMQKLLGQLAKPEPEGYI